MAASIDALMERYLILLDQYTSLREALNTAQTSMYQSLARANFSAERGIRYGQDFYDQRMQAMRRLTARVSDLGAPQFDVRLEQDHLHPDQPDVESAKGGEETAESDAGEGIRTSSRTKEENRSKGPTDPLKWFGLLTPASLRSAQSHAVEAVERIIPRLASVDLEMAEVEIQVRRARKKRAKAEAADKKAAILGERDRKELAT
jgi:coiled-coil domain-containing protein 115